MSDPAGDSGEPEQPKVKIGDEEFSLEEVKAWKEGNMRQEDYTQKTQALSQSWDTVEKYSAWDKYLEDNPDKAQAVRAIIEGGSPDDTGGDDVDEVKLPKALQAKLDAMLDSQKKAEAYREKQDLNSRISALKTEMASALEEFPTVPQDILLGQAGLANNKGKSMKSLAEEISKVLDTVAQKAQDALLKGKTEEQDSPGLGQAADSPAPAAQKKAKEEDGPWSPQRAWAKATKKLDEFIRASKKE